MINIDGHLFIIGFMGAGKSSVGEMLARRLGRPFYDLDERIERSAGAPVPRIFEREGEAAFRALETAQLQALEHESPGVVALGGGAVTTPANLPLMRGMGRVVYLKVSVGEALARIGDTSSRPLLSGPGGVLAATALYEARQGLYDTVADVAVDTDGKDTLEVVEAVIEALQEGGL